MLREQRTANKLLILAGILLWSMMGALFVKQAFAFNVFGTTCGSYTGNNDPGGPDDGGYVPPFVNSGEIDPDCTTPEHGNDVCYQKTSPGCLLGNTVSPPRAIIRDQSHTQLEWFTDQVIGGTNSTSYVLFVSKDAYPDGWRCFYDTSYACPGGAIDSISNMNNNYDDGSCPICHQITYELQLIPNNEYYFTAYGQTRDGGIPMQSEVRTFVMAVAGYTIDVTPPANTNIVTGETTDWYTVTVHPTGNPTGDITFSLGNWAPAISGETTQWEDGSAVLTLDGTNNDQTKRFRLQTNAGAPPAWPPVTMADVYGFRVTGSHPTLGQKFEDIPNGLTVMDYHMLTSTTIVTMPATGNANFPVTVDWLPQAHQYDRTVTLAHTNYSWLTVTYDQYVPPLDNGDPSFRVNFATVNAPTGDHPVHIIGTGVGGLTREIVVTIHIANPPDFSLSIAQNSQNVNQGDTVANTVTAHSINNFSEPVVLSGNAIRQGQSNPEPTITLSFAPPQPQPPANGTVNSVVTLTTTNATPCAPAPGQLYSVTIEGADNTQVGPPDAVRSVNYNLYVVCALQQGITMTVQPNPQSVNQGDVATYHVTVTSVNGFTGQVNLNLVSSCPTGSSCVYPQFVNVAPNSPGLFDFVVDTDPNTPPGQYPMDLNGVAEGDPTINASVQMILNVAIPPDYTFSISPSTLVLNVGTAGTYTATITPVGGFSTPVAISWVMNPVNPLVGFSPQSGNLVIAPGDSAPITVTANPGTIGTYTLDFTAQPQGPGNTKHVNNIILTIQNAICNGDCPNVCVDQENVPLVPEQTCTQDSECPTNYRCASQTCLGEAGCQPDPLPGPFDCNKDACYDDSGQFIIPAVDPACHQSWPRCKTYDVLKVRKDRQCAKWLSCQDSVTFTDPTAKKDVTQCVSLGVCNQLSPSGECANFLPEQDPKENMTFLSPSEVTGTTSQIRNYTGYSSGFHFTRVCEQDRTIQCTDDTSCGGNGPCVAAIESTYPSQAIDETGLDGATGEDLVKNGTFEELRCFGGQRDGLSCILPSDCRVGQGICTNDAQTLFSRVPCERDVDCKDATDNSDHPTQVCRYLVTQSLQVDCPNPIMSRWLGVKKPGEHVEAGYEDTTQGVKWNAAGEGAVRVMVREDPENIKNLSASTSENDVYPDARHPARNDIAEEHLKEGNNYLRATIKPAADEFSGVGVPLAGTAVEDGKGYVLSFKFKYESLATPQESIKAQLAFNYDDVAGGYENTDANFRWADFPIVQGAPEVAIPGTTEWQTFVLGPIIPSGFSADKTALLNFVTTEDHNYTSDTVFDIDDVTLKPVLDVAQSHLSAVDTKKLERRCRLYPRNESPECDYSDENATRYKGWRGYCLDKDPQNENLCLTWWPLDLLAGESPFTVGAKTGYDDRSPLYYCMQEEGGDKYIVKGERKCGGNNNKCQWFYNLSGLNVRWRDVEKVAIVADSKDDKFSGPPDFSYNAIVTNANGNDYEMIIKPNWDAGASLWGWGAFCLFDGEGCTEQWNQGWDRVYADSCDDSGEHHDDQYMAAAVKIQNPNNPDATDAIITQGAMQMCDDRDNDFDGDGPFAYIIIYLRASCNALVQTVKTPGEDKVNKAWVQRTDQASSYVVPDLGFGYQSDKAPFGAMSTEPLLPPDLWAGQNGWGNDPQRLDAMTLAEPMPGGNIRAGTAYSCRGECGSSDNNSKYCYATSYPDGPCENGNCNGDGISNRCETRDQINTCLSHADSVCVGRPLGRCTGNLLIPCGSDSDCTTANAGICSLSDVGKNHSDYTYARDHLKRLFAASYGCWELKSIGPYQEDGRTVWHTKYNLGCQQAGGTWDVMTDSDGGYCENKIVDGVRWNQNTRPDYPNDYCAVRPTITQGSYLINSQSSGDMNVAPGDALHGSFFYSVDGEQQPLSNATIVWTWTGSSDGHGNNTPESACANAQFSGAPDVGKVSLTDHYESDQSGQSFHPIACVKDNWEAVRSVVYPGTITVR